MKLWRFEGTSEEFNAVSEALIGKSAQDEDDVQSAESAPTSNRREGFVNVQEATEILTRRELSDYMLRVLIALYKAGSERLTSDALKRVNGHNHAQFRGMMGAFGRRTRFTVPEGVHFFDYQWEPSHGQYIWSLPETVREAMRQLKLV